MGLGKTLSMLAAIAVTANSANNFVEQGASTDIADNQKPRTRGTLVIVPSARESPPIQSVFTHLTILHRSAATWMDLGDQ